jgi:hypothetical protein
MFAAATVTSIVTLASASYQDKKLREAYRFSIVQDELPHDFGKEETEKWSEV